MRPHLSRAQYIMSYVTMQRQCIAAFGGLQAKQQQMKVVLCCLDGENVVGSRKDPVFFGIFGICFFGNLRLISLAGQTKKRLARETRGADETAESALLLYRSRNIISLALQL